MFVSILAAPQPLESLASLLVERVAQARAVRLLVTRLLEGFEERAGRALLHRLARRAPDGEVGRDEADLLVVAVLGGEPLEQCIRVRRVADCERPDLGIGADAVPDEHSARAADGDEGG